MERDGEMANDALLRELDDRGFVVIEGALSLIEVRDLNEAIERDLSVRPDAWPERIRGTRQSTTVLRPLTGWDKSPFDELTRHGSALPLLRVAYQDDMAFSEMSIIVKDGAHSSVIPVPSHAAWHHDGHHPQCGTSLMQSSVIYYLTDVPVDGACFTVVPGSHLASSLQLDQARALWPAADDSMPGAHRIAAPAGTAIVMNSNIWHASQPNQSELERRTVHVYYHRPWVKPVGLTRDGLSYMPRLAATVPKHASKESADGEWWHRFYHGPLLDTLELLSSDHGLHKL
jgi:ectoine hydroxylase-related dioxygenase (phytanoyl-CoA dioxygenase family)